MGNVYRRDSFDPDHFFSICYPGSNPYITHSNENEARRGTNISVTEHPPSPANEPFTSGYQTTSNESSYRPSAYPTTSNESSYRPSAYPATYNS